jgi:uncharacterized protein YdeI (YjbR/CyaY-like superfamily)
VDGKNIVIMQGFKEYFGLGFFQGALLKDPKRLLVQLGQVHAGRVMKFTNAKEITAQAATIKAYVREAVAVEKAGRRMKPKRTSDLPVPEELTERFRRNLRFKRAFEALTPGRQRSYLYHFGAAKQSATRVARIEKAMPAIFEGRGSWRDARLLSMLRPGVSRRLSSTVALRSMTGPSPPIHLPARATWLRQSKYLIHGGLEGQWPCWTMSATASTCYVLTTCIQRATVGTSTSRQGRRWGSKHGSHFNRRADTNYQHPHRGRATHAHRSGR